MRCKSIWAILLLTMLAGCGTGGPEIVPVTGRVTLDGKPLEEATVVFQPAEGNRPSTSQTDADGRYQLMYKRGVEGARVGKNKVSITVSHEIVRNPPKFKIEPDLTREVESGKDNSFDFELQSEQ